MTYFVHRPRSEPLQQPTQHCSILQRRLEEGLRVRDALLGGFQDPQRNKPRYRLLGRVHVRQLIEQQRRRPWRSKAVASLSYWSSVLNEAGRAAPPRVHITITNTHWDGVHRM